MRALFLVALAFGVAYGELSACCGSIKLDGGSMSDLYQSARMGNYRLTHTDANGRPVYDQVILST